MATTPNSKINRIGKYEIQSELARGGFGLVLRAFDPTVGRLVAIKVLNTEGDQEALARFRHEAASAGNLHHRNIVTIYEYGQHNEQPFIAMEFLEGHTLQEVIASRKPLSLLERMEIMSQVADGLYCAHRNGVIHRDVKPGNIMCLPDGTVKIMDFGIARAIRHTTARLTQVGDLVGTLRYMAPEQFKITDVDALCDIFAYGVVYYELITGTHPFEAPDAAGLLYRITAENPTPVRTLVPDCPEALERLIHRAMFKDREQRYPSLDELQLDAGPIIADLRRQRAGDLLEPARTQLESGDLDGAQTLIRRVLELDPANRDARRLRTAVQEQVRARTLRAKVETLVRTGEQCLAARTFDEAVEAFQSALRLNNAPEIAAQLASAQALLEQSRHLARCLADAHRALAAKDFESARRSAAEALQVDPQNAEASALAGEIQAAVERRLREDLSAARGLILIGEFDRAMSVLNPLRAEDPGLAAVEELIAQVDVQKAAQQRRQALQNQVAELRELIAAARWRETLVRLESLLPEYPESRRLRALFEEARNGLAAEREAALQQAIEQVGLLRGQAQFEQALERISSARDEFGPVPALAELEQTVAHEWQRHTEAEEIRKAVETGRQLLSAGRLNSAIFALREFAARYPQAEPVGSLLAEAEQQLRTEQHKAHLALIENSVRAAAVGKDFDSALRQLAEARKSDPDEARLQELEQAVHTEKAAYERARVVRQVLEGCDPLLAGQRYDQALEWIERTLAAYPQETALLDLRQRVRQQRDAEQQAARKRLAETTVRQRISERITTVGRAIVDLDFAAAARLAEDAQREFPQEVEFERLLKVARDGQHRREVGAILSAVEEKLAAGDRSAARKLVAQGLKLFPKERRLLLWQQQLDPPQTTAPQPPPRGLSGRLPRPLFLVIAVLVLLAVVAAIVALLMHSH